MNTLRKDSISIIFALNSSDTLISNYAMVALFRISFFLFIVVAGVATDYAFRGRLQSQFQGNRDKMAAASAKWAAASEAHEQNQQTAKADQKKQVTELVQGNLNRLLKNKRVQSVGASSRKETTKQQPDHFLSELEELKTFQMSGCSFDYFASSEKITDGIEPELIGHSILSYDAGLNLVVMSTPETLPQCSFKTLAKNLVKLFVPEDQLPTIKVFSVHQENPELEAITYLTTRENPFGLSRRTHQYFTFVRGKNGIHVLTQSSLFPRWENVSLEVLPGLLRSFQDFPFEGERLFSQILTRELLSLSQSLPAGMIQTSRSKPLPRGVETIPSPNN